MKNRSIVLVLIMFFLFGCSSRHLARLTDDTVEIDLTKDFDVYSVLTDIKNGTEISYEIDYDNEQLIIFLKNDKKTEELRAPAFFIEPEYTIENDIVFDVAKGFDIHRYIKADNNTTVECLIDMDRSLLKITLINGKWTKYIEKEITIINSSISDDDSSETYDVAHTIDGEVSDITDNSGYGDSSSTATDEDSDSGESNHFEPGENELPLAKDGD